MNIGKIRYLKNHIQIKLYIFYNVAKVNLFLFLVFFNNLTN